MDYEKLSLDNVGGEGVAKELFGRELDAVIANIIDVNTSATDVRELCLKVKFKPGSDREMSAVTVQCTKKLAATSKINGSVFLTEDNGGEAYHRKAKEQEIFDGEGNITSIKAKESGSD